MSAEQKSLGDEDGKTVFGRLHELAQLLDTSKQFIDTRPLKGAGVFEVPN